MKRLALATIPAVLAAFSVSGCVYKMNIQQGNYLVTDSVSQLKEGMTRSQVRFLLGTPMVPVAFDDSRWDYYYFLSSRHFRAPLKRRLTVHFADDRVQRIENQGVATQTDLAQLERDLKRAIEATRKKQRPSFWKRVFGRGDTGADTTTEAPRPTNSAEEKAQQPPDPVPPPSSLPEPAGTPSDQP